MSIQSTLTLAIEVIFNLFIGLMIFDLINGLWIVPLQQVAIAQPQIVLEPTSSLLAPHLSHGSNPWELELEPQQLTVIASQFEQLPDPWKLDVETPTPSTETQPVLLTFPTLKLLPPVQEVQPKPKRTKAANQTAYTAKVTSTKALGKPGRPRKKAA
jgi:hypothetical protein